MAAKAVVCPVCGAESDKSYRCSECGKLFDGDESAGGDRAASGRGA